MPTSEERPAFGHPWAFAQRASTQGATDTPQVAGARGGIESPTEIRTSEDGPTMASNTTEAETSSKPWKTTYSEEQEGVSEATVDAVDNDAPVEEIDASARLAAVTGAHAVDPDSATIGQGRDDAAPLGSAEVSVAPISDAPATPTRILNPLMSGLVRAMREAAETARTELLAKTEDEAKARIEAIQAAGETEAAELQVSHDQDVSHIRDWSKAQVARVREMTDARIADRKRRLELQTEDHTARISRRVEHVHSTVSAFETTMEDFFQKLLKEEDAARLAGFAEQMPEPPALDDIEDAAGPWVLGADNAAAAEAEAGAGLDAIEFELEIPADETLSATVDSIDPEPTDEPTTSSVSVSGLVSVASIAGFKRSVAKAPGVAAISVASGPGGEFIFSVTHARSLDLGSVITDLSGFAATVTDTTDGALTVTATDTNGQD
ncbi:MAG: hypothetical protein ABI598_04265 [Chloroflexota bacterium]